MSAPTAASQSGHVTPQTEWANILREVATETFATMVGVGVVVAAEDEVRVLAEVTGMVGIAGQVRAIFSMRCSLKSATTLAAHMLGVSTEEAAAQKGDAVGEICNIIAGYFKSKVGLGDLCSLSVPTVLAGTSYQIHSSGRTWRLGVPLLYEGDPIWLSLDIKI